MFVLLIRSTFNPSLVKADTRNLFFISSLRDLAIQLQHFIGRAFFAFRAFHPSLPPLVGRGRMTVLLGVKPHDKPDLHAPAPSGEKFDYAFRPQHTLTSSALNIDY
jgi:hypothetical protein